MQSQGPYLLDILFTKDKCHDTKDRVCIDHDNDCSLKFYVCVWVSEDENWHKVSEWPEQYRDHSKKLKESE